VRLLRAIRDAWGSGHLNYVHIRELEQDLGLRPIPETMAEAIADVVIDARTNGWTFTLPFGWELIQMGTAVDSFYVERYR
jgi:hypothetical protein